MQNIDYTEGTLEQLENRDFTVSDEVRQIKRALQVQGSARYEIQYDDPEPNFDRRAVKGMLINLFDVTDAKYNVALSAAGGGSLYNMVVDTESTSKKILQRGNLKTRTTIIPMNKIVGGSIPQNKVNFAQNLVGRENCVPALECIRYDPSLKTVMEYAFGRVLICRDIDIAEKVTFHPQVKLRTITLDGDVIDPEGVLSGGAREEGSDRLAPVAEIKKLRARLGPKDNESRELRKQIEQLKQQHAVYNRAANEVEEVRLELEAVKLRLAQTSFQKQQQEIEDAKTAIG